MNYQPIKLLARFIPSHLTGFTMIALATPFSRRPLLLSAALTLAASASPALCDTWFFDRFDSAFEADTAEASVTDEDTGLDLILLCVEGNDAWINLFTLDLSYAREDLGSVGYENILLSYRIGSGEVKNAPATLDIDTDGYLMVIAPFSLPTMIEMANSDSEFHVALRMDGSPYYETSFDLRGAKHSIEELVAGCYELSGTSS